LAALAVAAGTATAQGGGPTITGRVLTDAGTPLPSASVSIPSLGVGSYTDDGGNYRFTVPANRANGQTVTIMARRVGYAPKSVSVRLSGSGQIAQDFTLTAQSTQLTGVVVTALGVSRPKSELGTAQQQLTSEELNTTHDENVVNQLAGKVSGVNITGSGTQGGSTKITIRGASSITGNNDPLFIVDGQPVSNYDRGGSPNGGGLGGASNDYGSAINDINPDDIASISVLKGPNAAALYGSRAANGVIIITTKRGAASAGRVTTQINSSYTWDSPSILPQWQNLYGQGSAGQFMFVDGSGGGVQDFNDQSYGPKLDGRTMGCTYNGDVAVGQPTPYDKTAPCTQFTSPAANGQLQPVPWIAHPNNVNGFFQTGNTFDNNIAFSGGTDKATARLSLGSTNTKGVIPNNTLQKFTGNLSGTLDVSSRLTTTANVQYINNTGHNRAGVGYNTGILEGLYVWFGRQVDMNALKNYNVQPQQTVWGTTCNDQYNWNCNYHNNPYWIQYQNPELDNRDRVIASGSATWKITNWLNATGRTGTDYFRYNVDNDYGTGNLNFTDLAYNGAFSNFNNRSTENTSDLLLNASGKPSSWLQLNATLGGGMDYRHYASNQVTTDAILAPDIYNASNSAKPLTVNQYDERRRINSVYGSGSFTMRDIWTVEVTGRNDWSSTLPKGNNSYFYPSINSSIVLSDLIPGVKNRVINYAKLRGAIAEVGNDAGPYQLFTTYNGNANKFGSLPQYGLSDTRQNPNLKPEQTHSSEAGLELGMLDNRVTFDASYYYKSTRNEIVQVTLAPETGFNAASLNAGRMDNHGVEALLSIVPIRSQNFQWTSTFNYAANHNKLVALYPGLTTYVLGSTWTINTEARVGQPYGAIFGTPFKRDSATGELLLSGGLPQNDPAHRRVVGNINPKWVGGWNNEVRWKNLTASALLDFHRGGNIFSVTNMFGQETGVFKETLKGREVDWNNPGILVHGIDQATGKENTIRVTSENYFQSNFENAEWNLYDDSYVKLRELRVGLDLPSRLSNMFRATNVNVAFVGRNLWTHTKVPNIDPEFTYGTGNYQGAEFAALPTTRSLGLNVRITP
jgi:TonB-linked SusC/RagA family outer membrane protein